MDGPGFHVEIGALEGAASGIAQSVADQRESALDQLDRDEATYGHAGVHKAMENFCDRWSDGLDIMVKDADAIAGILTAAAKAYREADASAASRLISDQAARVVDD
jgi:hypothetical protein